jgi:hypothetical protein
MTVVAGLLADGGFASFAWRQMVKVKNAQFSREAKRPDSS